MYMILNHSNCHHHISPLLRTPGEKLECGVWVPRATRHALSSRLVWIVAVREPRVPPATQAFRAPNPRQHGPTDRGETGGETGGERLEAEKEHRFPQRVFFVKVNYFIHVVLKCFL